MKNLIILALLLLGSCGKRQDSYSSILKLLNKNYILNGWFYLAPKPFYNFEYNNYVSDSIDYKKGVDLMYQQGLPFINYLINDIANQDGFATWIRTESPYASTITPRKFYFTKQKGVKVTIDNLLTNPSKTIQIMHYIDKIDFEKLKLIVAESKNLEELKNKYKKYISEI